MTFKIMIENEAAERSVKKLRRKRRKSTDIRKGNVTIIVSIFAK